MEEGTLDLTKGKAHPGRPCEFVKGWRGYSSYDDSYKCAIGWCQERMTNAVFEAQGNQAITEDRSQEVNRGEKSIP